MQHSGPLPAMRVTDSSWTSATDPPGAFPSVLPLQRLLPPPKWPSPFHAAPLTPARLLRPHLLHEAFSDHHCPQAVTPYSLGPTHEPVTSTLCLAHSGHSLMTLIEFCPAQTISNKIKSKTHPQPCHSNRSNGSHFYGPLPFLVICRWTDTRTDASVMHFCIDLLTQTGPSRQEPKPEAICCHAQLHPWALHTLGAQALPARVRRESRVGPG